MRKHLEYDIIAIALGIFALYLIYFSPFLDIIATFSIYIGLSFILIGNVIAIILKLSGKNVDGAISKVNILAMFGSYANLAGLIFGTVFASPGPWNTFPFGFHLVLSLVIFLLIWNSMIKIQNALVVLLAVPILIVAITCQIFVSLIDLIFPPKLQELVPYIGALRDLFLNISQTMADPHRLEAEQALANLGNMADQVDDLGEGYALRKSVGQGIDLGLTAVVLIGLGVLNTMIDFGIPTTLVYIFFGSLGLAFATFSGFFGPFYGLASAAKDLSLRYGNYRGAAFYKTIEQLFAIPFMAASAGFMLLDLPPVDGETLNDFKNEMHDQITEISDNINSLLGKNQAAVPRKTRKMIAQLMESTTQNLGKLDFRNIREDTAREFALTYYQHEFSWKPWKRKSAISEFAAANHFDRETGEDTLRLIGYKIEAGQMDDDMVSNVMITAAMKGVIMMEQQYQELFEDVELGQTCTGLAFGARQFLQDHYIVRSKTKRIYDALKNFIIGVFAIPIVLLISYHRYANRFFDVFGGNIWNQRIIENSRIRFAEIFSNLKNIPSKLKSKRDRPPKTKEEKEQRNWELRRKFRKVLSMIWEVIVFPIVIILGIGKWLWKRISGQESTAREMFEEAVAHAALISMYNELYRKLVMQDHVSTAY